MNAFFGFLEKAAKSKWTWIIVAAFIIYRVARKEARRRKNDKGRFTDDIDRSMLKMGFDYTAFARKIYNAFLGVDVSGGDEWFDSRPEILKQLNGLNDDEFKTVYNEFNKLIGRDTSETLRDWIDDEILPFTPEDDKAIKRIDALGLA